MSSRGVAVRQPLDVALAVIPTARPRLPGADSLLPYLRRMDAARTYSNFGPLLSEFEARLAARFSPAAEVVTCVNATQALTLTLQALNLPRGSLVAVPAYTFVATAHAVLAAGLIPWFLDVDANDWMLRPETVRSALSAAPGPVSAAVPVAAFGALPDLGGWKALGVDLGLAVVVDAAAAFDQVRDASLPTVVSLHATKVLGVGEGGFLATTDAGLAAQVRQLTTFGFRGSRVSEIPATNAKLSEYTAVVGLAALDGWEADRVHYLRTARLMRAAMTFVHDIRFQHGWGIDWITSVCSVQLPEASAEVVAQRLEPLGIQTRRWWDLGCHTNPAFSACPRSDLTNTDRLGRSVLGLPFAIDMDERSISRVAGALAAALTDL